MEKQDAKDEQESAEKEFNDAGSKMNQIGANSKKHCGAEDDDYMQGVFEFYATDGKDKRGNPNGAKLLTKANALEASQDIIMKWNNLPEVNAKAYLDARFDKTWDKFDVLNKGIIDVSEATQFERSLMGTFSLALD